MQRCFLLRSLWVPLFLLASILPSASEQAVSFADLDGATIQARFLRQQTFIREGREISRQIQNDLKLEIGPGDKVQQTLTPTAYTPRGTRTGKTTSGSWTIEQPHEVTTRGGGDAVWAFADGSLTFLRTFKGGGFKRVFTFTRGADGLACTATENFAYEQGVRGIHMDGGIDDVPIVILSAKPISATCQIKTKR